MKLFGFLLSILIILSGCESKKDDPIVKTGVDLIAVGTIDFRKVIIGEYREAIIRFVNYGPNVITDFNPNTQLSAPFSVSSLTAACNSGTIPVNVTCELKIKFAPTTSNSWSQTVVIGEKSQITKGTGLDPMAVIDFSTSTFNLGSVIAGETIGADLTLTNFGSFSVQTPVPVSLPSGISIQRNDCGSFMAPNKVCIIRFNFIRTLVGTTTDTFIMRSSDIVDQTLSVTSQTRPGAPAGTITFNNPPASIIADSIDTKIIETNFIRDQFGNIVEDGNSITILPFNLTLIGPMTLNTVGGKISFTVQSTSQKGDATITLVGGGTGFLRFPALSGPAVGLIEAEPFVDSVNANGVTLIDIRLKTLKDQFSNIIEDNSPVYFELVGGGTLQSATLNTVLGTVRQIITPPTTTGTATLIIKAGAINGASVCGYSACGSYVLHYVPSDPSGNIPIIPVDAGIFADPALGISLGERIQTVVNIGPVKDAYNNIVATGTSLNLVLENGVNVFNTSLTTNASGMAQFSLAGTGNRGPIKINVSRLDASGTGQVWAYKSTTLRADSPGLPTSPYKLYMTYYSDLALPPVDNNWGLIKSWGSLDIQDNNFYGDKKKASPPTLVVRSAPSDFDHPTTRLPYFTQPCLFSSGINTYAGACYLNDFNGANSSSVQYTIQKNAVDNGTGMIPTPLSNLSSLALHNESPEGCYKYDTQAGSPTQGSFMIMAGVEFSQCGVVDVNVNPNGEGTWYGSGGNTPIPYYLKNPARGYISDLDKLLIFGGYYLYPELDFFGGHFLSTTSNKSSWLLNKGAGVSFNETEAQNINNSLGDYPSPVAFAQVATSSRDLFMFGGLNLQNTCLGIVCNYEFTSPSSEFVAYLGNSSKWQSLSPASDSTITDPDQDSSPSARYQEGMVYIPETNQLYIGSGKTRKMNNSNQYVWLNTNDLWSVQLDNLGDLSWKRECFPCSFPANAHFHPTNMTSESQLAPTDLRMTWNPYIQRVMMLWSGTSNQMNFFNPYQNGTKSILSESYSFNTGITSLVDSDLYQIEFNSDLGRTYFYKRKSNNPSTPNSDIWYWDMDTGNKQYYRVEINLGGGGVRDFIRDLTVNIRGYGKISDLSNNLITGGLASQIYNYTTNSWELLAINNANSSFDSNPNTLTNTYTSTLSVNYVSPEGKINLLIYPKGSSSNPDFNEVFLDEVYISGTF